MKVKNKFLPLSISVLGNSNEYIATEATEWYEYENGKKTDNKKGVKITVLIYNPDAEINYEKLDVKVTGATLTDFKQNEKVKFFGLRLSISNVEYGKATLVGYADKYEMVLADSRQADTTRQTVKINSNN